MVIWKIIINYCTIQLSNHIYYIPSELSISELRKVEIYELHETLETQNPHVKLIKNSARSTHRRQIALWKQRLGGGAGICDQWLDPRISATLFAQSVPAPLPPQL